eukprot:CAMPEP_0176084440 /NCGR_PEP_ID=MMETSP0120_2-20121206/42255_1 /TAXON_ID=160619 /ORGANISM="Kryptoperidinium foliaceum, Strain CCMP 1326" /LENGTH=172 /DNA_ID=CAMNT_0017418243 /DNA_START=45 /DNA_END=565 /DNA_ORIENTATION=+
MSFKVQTIVPKLGRARDSCAQAQRKASQAQQGKQGVRDPAPGGHHCTRSPASCTRRDPQMRAVCKGLVNHYTERENVNFLVVLVARPNLWRNPYERADIEGHPLQTLVCIAHPGASEVADLDVDLGLGAFDRCLEQAIEGRQISMNDLRITAVQVRHTLGDVQGYLVPLLPT